MCCNTHCIAKGDHLLDGVIGPHLMFCDASYWGSGVAGRLAPLCGPTLMFRANPVDLGSACRPLWATRWHQSYVSSTPRYGVGTSGAARVGTMIVGTYCGVGTETTVGNAASVTTGRGDITTGTSVGEPGVTLTGIGKDTPGFRAPGPETSCPVCASICKIMLSNSVRSPGRNPVALPRRSTAPRTTITHTG